MAESRCCLAGPRDRQAQAERRGEESTAESSEEGSEPRPREGPIEIRVGGSIEAGGQRSWGSNSPFLPQDFSVLSTNIYGIFVDSVLHPGDRIMN